MICMWFQRTRGVERPRSVHITTIVARSGFCRLSKSRLTLVCCADKEALPSVPGTGDRCCCSSLLLGRHRCTAHWAARVERTRCTLASTQQPPIWQHTLHTRSTIAGALPHPPFNLDGAAQRRRMPCRTPARCCPRPCITQPLCWPAMLHTLLWCLCRTATRTHSRPVSIQITSYTALLLRIPHLLTVLAHVCRTPSEAQGAQLCLLRETGLLSWTRAATRSWSRTCATRSPRSVQPPVPAQMPSSTLALAHCCAAQMTRWAPV